MLGRTLMGGAAELTLDDALGAVLGSLSPRLQVVTATEDAGPITLPEVGNDDGPERWVFVNAGEHPFDVEDSDEELIATVVAGAKIGVGVLDGAWVVSSQKIPLTPEQALDALFATYTLDVNPIEANVTKDGSNIVSALQETGTVGGALAQSTEANKPLWEVDGGNGKPCIVIQDVSDRLERNATYNDYLSVSEAFMITVVTTDGIGSGNRFIVNGANTRLSIRRATAVAQALHSDVGADIANGTPNLVADTRTIIAVRHLSGQVGISINGGAWIETASGDTTQADALGAWSVGGIGNSSNPGKVFRWAAAPDYPGDEAYAELVELLAEVYGVTLPE